jgi:hypothetical protein
MRRVLLLCGGSAAFWLLASLPFRILADDRERGNAAVAYAGVAMLLCLIPACGTLLWASRSLNRSPDEQMVAILGGTGLRLFPVALAGFALSQGVPYFQKYPGFLIWLAAAYLFTLTLEIALLLAGRPAAEEQKVP